MTISNNSSNSKLLTALSIALVALEAVTKEMTLGFRFTNAGQLALDALEPVRDAIKHATID
jgi:hypothetical protein